MKQVGARISLAGSNETLQDTHIRNQKFSYWPYERKTCQCCRKLWIHVFHIILLKLQIYCKTSTILYFLSVGTSSRTTIAVNIVCEQWEMLSTGKQQRCQVLEHTSLFWIKVTWSCVLIFPISNSVCVYWPGCSIWCSQFRMTASPLRHKCPYAFITIDPCYKMVCYTTRMSVYPKMGICVF